jgi:DNA/RNA endonuclease G (NUC1)
MTIILDQMFDTAGSERVAQSIGEEFAEADVYNLAYNPQTTFPYFSNWNIRRTWLNRFVRSMPAFACRFLS